MDIYAQNILEHFKNPSNKGFIKGADVTHNEANLSCGDKLKVDLKIKNNKLADFKFSGGGCAISQAAISILGEQIIGKSLSLILKLNFDDVKKYLGVSVSERRAKCALLGLITVQNAILKSKGKKLKKWNDYFFDLQ